MSDFVETLWDETRGMRWVQEHRMEYAIFRKSDPLDAGLGERFVFQSYQAADVAIRLGHVGGLEWYEVRSRPDIRWMPVAPESEA